MSKISESLGYRPTWDEYFLLLAKLAATRSTCLAFPVGAVIVKDRRVLTTGYNGPPSGTPHCVDLGYCYPELKNCDSTGDMPSRAIHAEANAISQAAKSGVSVNNASIYVTLEPCLSCLKLIVSSGIREVFYEESFSKALSSVRDIFTTEGTVVLNQVSLSQNAIDVLLTLAKPISIKKLRGVENP